MSLKQAGFMSTPKIHQPLLSHHKKVDSWFFTSFSLFCISRGSCVQFTFKYVKMMAYPFSLQMILEMFPTKLSHSLWFTVLLHSEVSLSGLWICLQWTFTVLSRTGIYCSDGSSWLFSLSLFVCVLVY